MVNSSVPSLDAVNSDGDQGGVSDQGTSADRQKQSAPKPRDAGIVPAPRRPKAALSRIPGPLRDPDTEHDRRDVGREKADKNIVATGSTQNCLTGANQHHPKTTALAAATVARGSVRDVT